jgi:hypothetical protein
MQKDFLGSFIGNVNRARLLRVFLFNRTEQFTPGSAAKRAGISLAAAGKEIKALEKLGVIKKGRFAITLVNGKPMRTNRQKQQTWIINPECRHLRALTAFVHEVSPAQYDVVVGALRRSGKLATVILSGVFMGDPSRPADILLAGDALNEHRLEDAVKKLEPLFGRELRYAAFSTPEFRYRLTVQDRLVRDTLDYPHLVLLDRGGILFTK